MANQDRGDILYYHQDRGYRDDFLLLVSRVFLKKLYEGDMQEAIAYGRALLVLMHN